MRPATLQKLRIDELLNLSQFPANRVNEPPTTGSLGNGVHPIVGSFSPPANRIVQSLILDAGNLREMPQRKV